MGRSLFRLVVVLMTVAGWIVMAGEPAAAAPPWWNGSYSHRLGVSVLASDALPNGYSIAVTFDHAAMVGAGNSLASGNDVRIARWDGGSWSELDRVLQPNASSMPSAWNTSTTKIWFRTQTAINAATTDTSYYLYYGNAAAGAPPADGNNVFDLYDDFNGGAFDTAKWTSYDAAGLTVSQTGGQLRITGTPAPQYHHYAGFESDTTFTPGYAVESTFEIVSQDASVQAAWKGEYGLIEDALYVNNEGSGQRVMHWDGLANTDHGASSLTGLTLTSRVVQTLSADGTAQHFEDGVRQASRTGAPVAPTTIQVFWSPEANGAAVDVRFDDVIVRKFVANEPSIALDESRDVTVSVNVNPSLTFIVASNPGGTCNGIAHTAGASADATTVNFGSMSGSTTAFVSQNATATTNADLGVSVYARYTGTMSGAAGTIDDWTGTNAAPTAPWSAGTEAFGYTTSDSTLSVVPGAADRFTNGSAKFAQMTTANEEVSFNDGPTTSNTICVGYRIGVSNLTSAGVYATSVIYTAVPTY
jgi:hypothetical protein